MFLSDFRDIGRDNMFRIFFLVIYFAADSVVSENLGQADTEILRKFGGPTLVMTIALTATALLILVLLVKRQLLRKMLIPKSGAHTTVASGAPRKIAREIEASIRRVERLRIEPRTLAENIQQPSRENLRSQTGGESVSNLHNLRYRYKAMDSMTCLDDLLCSVDVRYCRKSHQTVRDHLTILQKPPHAPFSGSEVICENVVKLYEDARYGKKEFGEQEYEQLANHIEDLKGRLRQKVTIPGTLVSSDVAGSSREVPASSAGPSCKVFENKPTSVIYSSTGKSSRSVEV